MSCRSLNSTSPTRTTYCGQVVNILVAFSSDTSDTLDFITFFLDSVPFTSSPYCLISDILFHSSANSGVYDAQRPQQTSISTRVSLTAFARKQHYCGTARHYSEQYSFLFHYNSLDGDTGWQHISTSFYSLRLVHRRCHQPHQPSLLHSATQILCWRRYLYYNKRA